MHPSMLFVFGLAFLVSGISANHRNQARGPDRFFEEEEPWDVDGIASLLLDEVSEGSLFDNFLGLSFIAPTFSSQGVSRGPLSRPVSDRENIGDLLSAFDGDIGISSLVPTSSSGPFSRESNLRAPPPVVRRVSMSQTSRNERFEARGQRTGQDGSQFNMADLLTALGEETGFSGPDSTQRGLPSPQTSPVAVRRVPMQQTTQNESPDAIRQSISQGNAQSNMADRSATAADGETAISSSSVTQRSRSNIQASPTGILRLLVPHITRSESPEAVGQRITQTAMIDDGNVVQKTEDELHLDDSNESDEEDSLLGKEADDSNLDDNNGDGNLEADADADTDNLDDADDDADDNDLDDDADDDDDDFDDDADDDEDNLDDEVSNLDDNNDDGNLEADADADTDNLDDTDDDADDNDLNDDADDDDDDFDDNADENDLADDDDLDDDADDDEDLDGDIDHNTLDHGNSLEDHTDNNLNGASNENDIEDSMLDNDNDGNDLGKSSAVNTGTENTESGSTFNALGSLASNQDDNPTAAEDDTEVFKQEETEEEEEASDDEDRGDGEDQNGEKTTEKPILSLKNFKRFWKPGMFLKSS